MTGIERRRLPTTEAKVEVDRFLDDLGWWVEPDAPAKRELASALAPPRQLGWNVGADVFRPCARAADELAVWSWPALRRGSRTVEAVVVGSVVSEAVLIALRRLAEGDHSAAMFRSAN